MKKLLASLLALSMMLGAAAYAENSETPPAPPSGEMGPPPAANGQPPEKPDGTPPDGFGGGTPPDGFGGGTPPGGGASSFEYSAATEITEAAELAGGTYASETTDESALIINTADSVTVTFAKLRISFKFENASMAV